LVKGFPSSDSGTTYRRQNKFKIIFGTLEAGMGYSIITGTNP